MTFEFAGIDHVQLAAPEGCEQAARAFYADLLGWREIPKPESLRNRGGVWFQCGIHQVHIGVQPDFRPAVKAHPAFHVRHIDVLQAYLTSKMLKVSDDDARADEGVKRFYLNDPFGNRLEFLEWIS
ncbi:VOC family protein [Paenibacillus sp. MBLB4367]|uniref:VOC family protein n=1 Tax=Paenibacillus sp. MBLB4367 TaxID=3384767 RepID=UPI0039081DA2